MKYFKRKAKIIIPIILYFCFLASSLFSLAAEFENTYSVEPIGFNPNVQNSISGSIPEKAQEFTFVIDLDPECDTTGIIMPEKTSVTITGAGTAVFDEIKFTKAGTYSFGIGEMNEEIPGYTFDEKTWTLDVEIIDEDGILTYTAVYINAFTGEERSQEALFTNIYAPTPVSYAPMVEKMVVESMPDDDDIFTFKLKETDDAGLLEGILETSVAGLGTAKFREITFTKAGTYTFEITEVVGNKDGYTYDESVWTLTVVVEDVDAELKITSHIYDKNNMMITYEDAAQFVNVYIKDDDPPIEPPIIDEPSTDLPIIDEPTTDETTTEPPTETAKPTDVNTSTQTGDSMNLILWISIMVVAVVAAGVIVVIRIKKRR